MTTKEKLTNLAFATYLGLLGGFAIGLLAFAFDRNFNFLAMSLAGGAGIFISHSVMYLTIWR